MPCTRQYWGHVESKELRAMGREEVDVDATSFRIDCWKPLDPGQIIPESEYSYWLLIHPGRTYSQLPPTSPKYVAEGEEPTDLTEDPTDSREISYFPKIVEGTPEYVDYMNARNVLKTYYSELLEWPPRVKLESRHGKRKTNGLTQDERKRLQLFRQSLAKHGHSLDADSKGELPHSFMQWLVARNIMPFATERQPSRMGLGL